MEEKTYSIAQTIDLLAGAGHMITHRRVSQFCLKIDARIELKPRPHYRLTESQISDFVGQIGSVGKRALMRELPK
jgi:hypothetical protein